MSYDDDYDFEDEPSGPDVIAGLTAEVHINVPPLDLETEVGGRKLVDLVVEALLNKLAKGRYAGELQDRVKSVRDDEIREATKAEIAAIFAEGFQPTNRFGEPQGEPTTLRMVIAEQAKKIFDERADSYNRGKTLREIVHEEVTKALKAELAEVVEAEKKKVIALIRGQASTLIAEATVQAGLAAKTDR